MLIGRFKIKVSWNIELGMSLENCNVRRTGINPNVQGVAALRRPLGKIEKGSPFSIRFFKPDVGAFLLNEIGNFLGQISRDDGLTIFLKENRKRNTPSSLTRNTPVRPGFDSSVNTITTPIGKPLNIINLTESLFAKPLH